VHIMRDSPPSRDRSVGPGFSLPSLFTAFLPRPIRICSNFPTFALNDLMVRRPAARRVIRHSKLFFLIQCTPWSIVQREKQISFPNSPPGRTIKLFEECGTPPPCSSVSRVSPSSLFSRFLTRSVSARFRSTSIRFVFPL